MDDATDEMIAAQLAAGLLASGQYTLHKMVVQDGEFAVGLYQATLAALRKGRPRPPERKPL